MQIFMDGTATRNYAPDQISISIRIEYKAYREEEALRNGVNKVSDCINTIMSAANFSREEIKTRAYSIHEVIHRNYRTNENISDGYEFSQYMSLVFDYNHERLAKVLVACSRLKVMPNLNIRFGLKDIDACSRELIADAYNDAKLKAEALANAAGKHLRDCVRVDIDSPDNRGGYRGDIMAKAARNSNTDEDVNFMDEVRKIDENFRPDDIKVTKTIKCVWETSD